MTGRFGRAERERAAAAVRPTSPQAAERLRRFVEEGGAMVTTGQQAGLFTGPLYTVHKILTAVRLAEALERALGVVVLPVFWVASEDADFAEVAHAHAVTPEGDLRRASITPTTGVAVPMSEMALPGDIESTLDGYLKDVDVDGDAHPVFKRIRDAYRPGKTVAGAFKEAILALFAELDLLVTDAADPVVKSASLPIILGELDGAAEHEHAVKEQTAAFQALGYTAPVALQENATDVFYHGPAGRERLHREGDAFVAHHARARFTRAEVEAAVRANPSAFSPNVFLRPVVESAVFPTLAYVAGPAETAYFGQIRPLFEAFGIRMPVIFPRYAATIVADEVEARRQGLELDAAELAAPEHEVLEALARRRVPPAVFERSAALRKQIVDGFAGLMDAAHPVDAQLDLVLGARRDRILLEMAKAERKVIRHWKRRHARLAADLRLVRNHLRPLGQPQERVLTVLQYLARDPGLLHRLAEGMAVELADAAVAAGD